jgi:hypothetical protein
LFWLLPAVTESGRQTVTVVIVPLRWLLDDFLDKAMAHDIPAPGGLPMSTQGAPLSLQLWRRRPTHNSRPGFALLGARLKRVVFKEAHLTLTATYRPQMKSLATLRAVVVRFVIVTATAPPVLRDTLLDNFQSSQSLLHVMPTNRWRSHTLSPVTQSETCPRRCWPTLPHSGQSCRTKARSQSSLLRSQYGPADEASAASPMSYVTSAARSPSRTSCMLAHSTGG